MTTDIVLREETLPARTRGGLLEYDSNNSGGGWWLDDAAWEALAEAGWTVHWGARNSSLDPLIQRAKSGDRWLGALATTAAKHVPSAAEGIAEWERVTGQSAGDLGCNCCGPPHSFTYTPDNGDESRYISPEIPASAGLSGVGYD